MAFKSLYLIQFRVQIWRQAHMILILRDNIFMKIYFLVTISIRYQNNFLTNYVILSTGWLPYLFVSVISFLFIVSSPLFLNISDLYPTNQNFWLLTKHNSTCTAWVYDTEVSNQKSLHIPGVISRCYTIRLHSSSYSEILTNKWLILADHTLK